MRQFYPFVEMARGQVMAASQRPEEALGSFSKAEIRLAAARSEIDEIGRTFDDGTLRELFLAGATAKLG